MADRMQLAQQRLADRQAARCGFPVTYTRGGLSATLTAVAGRTDSQLQDGEAGRQRTEYADQDYLIAAADLAAAGFGPPQRGDRIAAGGEVHEVLPIPSEPHYRAADAYAIRWRIHTKRVA